MVKSSIVKKFVTLGVAGAMAISTLGASVASATYTRRNVDGGTWISQSQHSLDVSYGCSSYYHSKRNHTASVKSGRTGQIFRVYATKGKWAVAQRTYSGWQSWQTIYTYYNVL